jgi:hypothetical protein
MIKINNLTTVSIFKLNASAMNLYVPISDLLICFLRSIIEVSRELISVNKLTLILLIFSTFDYNDDILTCIPSRVLDFNSTDFLSTTFS